MLKGSERCVREIGRCIYCGHAGSELSNEHIIPYALGGYAYLGKASCAACQKITSRIEGNVLRKPGQLYNLRRSLGLRSRRKKSDRFMVDLGYGDGSVKSTLTEYSGAPMIVPIQVFEERPGILLGKPYVDDYKPQWRYIVVGNFQGRDVRTITLKVQISSDYERMMIKICYCAAVGRFGLDTLSPIVIDSILGRRNGLAYYIGEVKPSDYPNRQPKTLLSYSQHRYSDGRYILSVQFEPWSGDISPVYEVAVANMTLPMEEIQQAIW
jgi:hypothetical protein